jgi:hypothetical protein
MFSESKSFNDVDGDKRTLLYRSHVVDVFRQSGKDFLDVHWKDHPTMDQLRDGCEEILSQLQQLRLSKILNDSSKVSGVRADSAHWMAVDWLPRLKAGGLKTFAWVQSSDFESRQAANRTAFDAGDDKTIILFNDRRTAELWLTMAEA